MAATALADLREDAASTGLFRSASQTTAPDGAEGRRAQLRRYLKALTVYVSSPTVSLLQHLIGAGHDFGRLDYEPRIKSGESVCWLAGSSRRYLV